MEGKITSIYSFGEEHWVEALIDDPWSYINERIEVKREVAHKLKIGDTVEIKEEFKPILHGYKMVKVIK